MDDSTWIKVNVGLRVLIIIILLFIASAIVYYRFGVPPNLGDQQLKDALGNKITDCRTALVYYAENALTMPSEKADAIKERFNLTMNFNLSDFVFKEEK